MISYWEISLINSSEFWQMFGPTFRLLLNDNLTLFYIILISWWRHVMETSSASLGLYEGIYGWPVDSSLEGPGGCFTNVPRALQNNLAKIHNTRNHIYDQNFKLKLCTCAQSMALGTRTKFQLEILITSTISAIHKFRENILESSRNVSETTPRLPCVVTAMLRTNPRVV